MGVSISEKKQRGKFLTFASKNPRTSYGQEIYLGEKYAVSQANQETATVCMGCLGALNKPQEYQLGEEVALREIQTLQTLQSEQGKSVATNAQGPEKRPGWTFIS